MALHHQTHPKYVEDCYACKLASKALTFRYGRETFHGETIGERLADMKQRAAENGITMERASS